MSVEGHKLERPVCPEGMEYRPGMAPPPDRLPNPVIFVGVGSFGHSVLEELECRARAYEEVYGPESIRNLATLRVMGQQDLTEAVKNGFAPRRELTGGFFFRRPPEIPVLSLADIPDKPFVGLDPEREIPAESTSQQVLQEQIAHYTAELFGVGRFVDFHPDSNRYPSRLDVFVVSMAGDLLGPAVHRGVESAMASLVGERFFTLFRPEKSNVGLIHLVALPHALVPGCSRFARRILLTCRAQVQEIEAKGGPLVPHRFLFLEDRSHKYVLTLKDMTQVFVEFITLLTFRRTGNDTIIRDIVHPLPDIDRLRTKGYARNNVCGVFSVSTIEADFVRIIRYCRNRQGIAALNVFLHRAQDGELPLAEEGDPAAEAAERLAYYDVGKKLDKELDKLAAEKVLKLEADRKGVQLKHGVGDWKLGTIGEWEYHGNIVEPFHADIEGRGAPRYTQGWLAMFKRKILDFLGFYVREVVQSAFYELEREREARVREAVLHEKQLVDSLVESAPWGWKRACTRLEDVVRLVRRCLAHYVKEILSTRLRSVSERKGLVQCKQLLEEFEDHVDFKPVRKRYLTHMGVLGGTIGLALGTLFVMVLPYRLLGFGIPPALLAAGGVVAGLWFARRYNRGIYNELVEIVSDSPTCRMHKALDAAADELYRLDDPSSFLGERVKWLIVLWKVRFYRRLLTLLEQDLERLRDIGRILEIQLERFRSDQESIGVQFVQEGATIKEKTDKVLLGRGLFNQPLFSSASLEGIYQRWCRTPHEMALEITEKMKPFKDWRNRLPFAWYRGLAEMFVRPFLPIEEADFITLPETSSEAESRLMAFLGDFANKMELSADSRNSRTEDITSEEKLVIFHRDHVQFIRKMFQNLRWPPGWREESGLPSRHSFVLLRYLQGLSPWDLRSLGDQVTMVRELTSMRYRDALVDLVKQAEGPTLKTSMVAAACEELVRCRPEPWDEWKGCLNTLLDDFMSMEHKAEKPVDGARFVDRTKAETWVLELVDHPGLLKLVCRLFGCAMDEVEDPFEEALARTRLLVLAARNQPVWAYKELNLLPEEWHHPFVGSLVKAETVVDLVLQDRCNEALLLLEKLSPELLRLSCILKVAIVLAGKGRTDEAGRFLDTAFVPEGDGEPPPPVAARPDISDLLAVFEALRSHPKMAQVFLSVYGGPEYGFLDEDPKTERVNLLLRALPGGPPQLLRLLDSFPPGFLDPDLLTNARTAAL